MRVGADGEFDSPSKACKAAFAVAEGVWVGATDVAGPATLVARLDGGAIELVAEEWGREDSAGTGGWLIWRAELQEAA